MKKVKFLLLAGILTLCGQAAFGHGGEEQRIALEPDLSSMSAGAASYKFQLIDTDTNQLIGDSELAISHEKKLHLIIYDPSLKEFQHVHPEFDGKIWSADVQFAVDGDYWVWAQGELASDGTEFSSSTRLTISGGSTAWPSPPVLPDLRNGSSGISAIKLSQNKLTAGKMAMLDLTMSRTDGTTPKLTPYLGAFAHIIATPKDGDELIHVHPVSTGPAQGMIHAMFPTAGEYRLWVQFIDDGNLKTIPLSVEVF